MAACLCCLTKSILSPSVKNPKQLHTLTAELSLCLWGSVVARANMQATPGKKSSLSVVMT